MCINHQPQPVRCYVCICISHHFFENKFLVFVPLKQEKGGKKVNMRNEWCAQGTCYWCINALMMRTLNARLTCIWNKLNQDLVGLFFIMLKVSWIFWVLLSFRCVLKKYCLVLFPKCLAKWSSSLGITENAVTRDSESCVHKCFKILG